jgi:uncharacterized protein YgiM (DUF1202 family)
MVIFSCAICGIIGKLDSNSNNSSGAPTTATNNTGYTSQPQNSPIRETPKTFVSQPSSSSKSATVITGNANLRDTPNSAGTVIQTVPEGGSVEVLKQKGAWCYVLSNGRKGWMHGNNIRYENSAAETSTGSETDFSTPKPSYPSSVSKKRTETEINNSGATARCRDGTLSYSRNRRGTCSHHGGVAVWF